MKVVVLCLVLIAVLHVGLAKPVENLEGKWEKFKADFKKNYDSPEEEARRKELFRTTVEKIEEHNAKYEKGLVTYTQGINFYTDMTGEERRQFLGFKGKN